MMKTKISSLIEISSRTFNYMNLVARISKTIKFSINKAFNRQDIITLASMQGVEYSNSLFAGNKTDNSLISVFSQLSRCICTLHL